MAEREDSQDHLDAITGLTPWFKSKLKALNLYNLIDLALHLPYRWEDRSTITPISDVVSKEAFQIQGEIIKVKRPFRPQMPWTIDVEDRTGIVTIVIFFREKGHFKAPFTTGKTMRAFGAVKVHLGGVSLSPTRWQVFNRPSFPPAEYTPIYRLTDKLTLARLTPIIQQATSQLRHTLKEDAIDSLIKFHREKFPLLEAKIAAAYQQMHNRALSAPDPKERHPQNAALNRLVLEELASFYVAKKLDMKEVTEKEGHALGRASTMTKKLIKQLPFKLTGAQNHCVAHIEQKLTQSKPMATLLQGDVGSGKTIVALIAAMQAIESGVQVACIVPTEILARQHTDRFAELLKPFGIQPALLSGSTKAAQRRSILRDVENGSLPLLVGTHSLLSEKISWKKLGLVIIDEQHRFGVYQRNELLIQQPSMPHLLSMTATPIPRTLMLTLYNNLELLTLDERPANRLPITTVTLSQNRRDHLVERVFSHVKEGGQVYWICGLIEDHDQLEANSVDSVHQELLKAMKDLRISKLHGRMKSEEKQAEMEAFEQGKTQLLISTTVVEVGMDVPNATLVIIDGAERLGLAQMHQIRGRVGRGEKKSYCVLVHEESINDIAKQRLEALRDHDDGFELAKMDLQLRQGGNLIGAEQSGKSMKVADLRFDIDQLEQAIELGDIILKHPEATIQLLDRWQSQSRTPETIL